MDSTLKKAEGHPMLSRHSALRLLSKAPSSPAFWRFASLNQRNLGKRSPITKELLLYSSQVGGYRKGVNFVNLEDGLAGKDCGCRPTTIPAVLYSISPLDDETMI